MKKISNLKKQALVAAIVAGLLAAIRGLIALGYGDYWYSSVVRGLRGGMPGLAVFAVIVAFIVTITVCGVWASRVRRAVYGYNDGYSYRRTEPSAEAVAKMRRTRRNIMVIGGLTLLGLGYGMVDSVRAANRSEYDAVKKFAANLTEVKADRPAFDARVNIQTATVLLSQSIPAGGSLDVASIANVGENVCALVTRDGSWKQGTYTAGVVCLDNQNPDERQFAEFDTKVPHSNGTWGMKLGAFVTENFGLGLAFSQADVYGYIDGGNAKMVVPMVRKAGYKAPHDVPAGVIVFDHTGRAQMKDSVKAGEIPGPVLPASIAASVRQSVNTLDGLRKYDRPGSNDQALQDTSSSAKAEAPDPNAGNATEFVLSSKGHLYYVTMLTPYGSSTAVTATLVVEADTVTAGQMPKATLYRHGVQSGTGAVAQRITSLYANLQWAQVNDAAATEGNLRRIFEVTPADAGTVRATIGTGGQVQYVAVVDVATGAGDKVGEVCIYSAKTGEKVQCDGPQVDVTTLNVGDTTSNSNSTGETVEVNAQFDVADLTVDELKRLIADAADELARRAGK